MTNVQSCLNKEQYKRFSRQCKELNESEYEFVKKAVIERMAKNDSLRKKVEGWLFEKDLKL